MPGAWLVLLIIARPINRVPIDRRARALESPHCTEQADRLGSDLLPRRAIDRGALRDQIGRLTSDLFPTNSRPGRRASGSAHRLQGKAEPC